MTTTIITLTTSPSISVGDYIRFGRKPLLRDWAMYIAALVLWAAWWPMVQPRSPKAIRYRVVAVKDRTTLTIDRAASEAGMGGQGWVRTW